MLGREDQERGPIDGVDAGGENADGLPGRGDREIDGGALALPDPIALHGQDVVGPLGQLGVPELLGVIGDLEEPLLHLLLFDRVVAAPAGAPGRLLVGQDGAAGRAPVDPALAAVGQPALEHLEEHPLVPLVIFGQAGVDLPRPIIGEAHALELHLHVGDVVQGPLLGMGAVLDGGVLGRHAQGVPADGMEDIEAAHHLEAGDDVADAVVADVAHMDAARGVRIHLQAVELGFGRVLNHAKGVPGLPGRLPFGLDSLEIILFVAFASIAHGALVLDPDDGPEKIDR